MRKKSGLLILSWILVLAATPAFAGESTTSKVVDGVLVGNPNAQNSGLGEIGLADGLVAVGGAASIYSINGSINAERKAGVSLFTGGTLHRFVDENQLPTDAEIRSMVVRAQALDSAQSEEGAIRMHTDYLQVSDPNKTIQVRGRTTDAIAGDVKQALQESQNPWRIDAVEYLSAAGKKAAQALERRWAVTGAVIMAYTGARETLEILRSSGAISGSCGLRASECKSSSQLVKGNVGNEGEAGSVVGAAPVTAQAGVTN